MRRWVYCCIEPLHQFFFHSSYRSRGNVSGQNNIEWLFLFEKSGECGLLEEIEAAAIAQPCVIGKSWWELQMSAHFTGTGVQWFSDSCLKLLELCGCARTEKPPLGFKVWNLFDCFRMSGRKGFFSIIYFKRSLQFLIVLFKCFIIFFQRFN